MSGPNYTFDYRTTASDTVQPGLEGSTYWYDTGTTEGGEPVYYDTSETYAYWKTGFGYWVTVIADVGELPDDYYDQTGTGQAGWAGGSLAFSDVLITDAWYRAETSVFESFRAFVDGNEGNNCFRGFLPVQGDAEDLLYTNVWQLSSGNSDQFEMDRLWGADANWCSLRSDSHIESVWETREKAMQFSGAVLAWLKATDNMNEVGNVTWCTLSNIPDEPEIYRTDGKINRERYWRQTIDLEIVYKTENNYN